MNVGEDINITCLITGIPAPKVTWYQAQKTIRADKRYRVETTNESATLTVGKATLKDSAEFTLKLQNAAGSDKFTVKVDVVGEYSHVIGAPVYMYTLMRAARTRKPGGREGVFS